MRGPNCFVFPDGRDWIVFAPASRLVMRTNADAALMYSRMEDRGQWAADAESGKVCDVRMPDPFAADLEVFAPTYVTVSCTNACSNRCVYCYGTPAHENHKLLNPDFCRAALDFVGGNAEKYHDRVHAFFHGVGEPTLNWPLFSECVGIVQEAAKRHGVRRRINLCTSGQVEADQAQWIAENLEEVQVSLDGPADIQNAQRPRSDGKDSLNRPLALARAVMAQRKKLAIKTTVTRLNVHRMVEIVEFVASEIGPAYLQFGMMFAPAWVDQSRMRAPDWRKFVEQFERALDRGDELGVKVQHGTISFNTLVARLESSVISHFCLAPPNIVTLFYDVPEEGSADPSIGAYGWYDVAAGHIRFDHQKRIALKSEEMLPVCRQCPCLFACSAPGGVKGRMPKETPELGPACQARLGLLKVLLRRTVRASASPQSITEEKSA